MNDTDNLQSRISELEKAIGYYRKREWQAGENVVQLFAVIENLEEGITLSDDSGHFEIFNSKMGEITDYTMLEANSHADFTELLYPDIAKRREALAKIGEIAKTGSSENIETTICTKSGEAKTLLVSTSVIFYKNRRMFLSVYRDITGRKRTEDLKNDFMNMVSHELRVPLCIVDEGVKLLLDRIPGELNTKQSEILSISRSNVERLVRLINNLLDLSKIESKRMEMQKKSFDLSLLLKEMVSCFDIELTKKGLEVVMDIPKSLMIYADLDKTEGVMMNLLSNALKFTDNGRIEISVRESEKEIECAVSDTGIGISREDLPKLFDKFQQFGHPGTRDRKGSGLGLPITKALIELHGGRIWAESEPGKWTKISFTLPKQSIN